MMARGAGLKGIASCRLRRLLAFNRSCAFADVKIGDAVLCHEAQSKTDAPRRRVPALILGIGDTGVTAKFQSKTFKVARLCARK